MNKHSRNQTRPAALDTHQTGTRGKPMKALSKLNRNDVIRAVALVTVVAFPLIAYAQLGSASKVATLTVAAAPAAAEIATPAKAVAADPCANQHWPFFSAECL